MTWEIAIHILPNISRSKRNQTKKFDLLIENNMRNILHKILKNHTQNLVEKLFPDPFLWICSLKFYSLFLLYVKFRAIEKY